MTTTTSAEGIADEMRRHLDGLPAQERVTLCVSVLMRARGDRQVDVAEALGLGRTGLGHKLQGRNRWSMDDLDGLARYFGVDLAALMGEAAVSGAVSAFFAELVGPRYQRPLRVEPSEGQRFANGSYRTAGASPDRVIFLAAAA